MGSRAAGTPGIRVQPPTLQATRLRPGSPICYPQISSYSGSVRNSANCSEVDISSKISAARA